jgi:hypothetical protein
MNNKKGSILAIVVIFIFIFTLLGMFAMRLVILQNETSDSELYYTRAHFAALYGSELALYRVMQWESIATSSTFLNPDGRKFLAEDSSCFNYSSGKWYPLEGMSVIEENFVDEVTGGTGSGIHLECSVEEDLNPNVNDGYIPDMNMNSKEQKYGTYKFYVIKTTATIYKDLNNKTGDLSGANDNLYFMISYSTGPSGAIAWDTIGGVTGLRYDSEVQQAITAFVNDPKMIAKYPNYSTRYSEAEKMIKEKPYTSAQYPSLITGQIQPIFRYYIRGRR